MARDLAEARPPRVWLSPIHKVGVRVESTSASFEKILVAVKKQGIAHKRLDGDFRSRNYLSDWITG